MPGVFIAIVLVSVVAFFADATGEDVVEFKYMSMSADDVVVAVNVMSRACVMYSLSADDVSVSSNSLS